MVCSTGGPPVEAPMAMTLTPAGARPMTGSGGPGADISRRTRGQRRTTLTSDINFTVCTSSRAVAS
jgi:hypothetical protein